MAGSVHAVDGLPVGVLYLLGKVHVTAAQVVQFAFELVGSVRIELDAGFLTVQLVGLTGHVLEVGDDLRVMVNVDAYPRVRIVPQPFYLSVDSRDRKIRFVHLHDVRSEWLELENRVLKLTNVLAGLAQNPFALSAVLLLQRGLLGKNLAILLRVPGGHRPSVAVVGCGLDGLAHTFRVAADSVQLLFEPAEAGHRLVEFDLRRDFTVVDAIDHFPQCLIVTANLDRLGQVIGLYAPFRGGPARIVNVHVQWNVETFVRVTCELAA